MKPTLIPVILIALFAGLGHTSTVVAAPDPSSDAPAGLIAVNTVVDERNADGDCSLREALSAAGLDTAVDACPVGSGDDTIILPAGRYLLSLAGASEDAGQTGDLDLNSNITIVGAGSDVTIIDGNRIDRVLDIHAGAHVVISGVTITNGKSPGGVGDSTGVGGNAEPGGGIRNDGESGSSAVS